MSDTSGIFNQVDSIWLVYNDDFLNLREMEFIATGFDRNVTDVKIASSCLVKWSD